MAAVNGDAGGFQDRSPTFARSPSSIKVLVTPHRANRPVARREPFRPVTESEFSGLGWPVRRENSARVNPMSSVVADRRYPAVRSSPQPRSQTLTRHDLPLPRTAGHRARLRRLQPGERHRQHAPRRVTLLPFLLLGVALLIALGFEFVNGFHDTANAVATVIYTHSLQPHVAVRLLRHAQFPRRAASRAAPWPSASSRCCRSS